MLRVVDNAADSAENGGENEACNKKRAYKQKWNASHGIQLSPRKSELRAAQAPRRGLIKVHERSGRASTRPRPPSEEVGRGVGKSEGAPVVSTARGIPLPLREQAAKPTRAIRTQWAQQGVDRWDGSRTLSKLSVRPCCDRNSRQHRGRLAPSGDDAGE
jgi:hypothetical protein